MTIHRVLRMVAGFFILLSLMLAHYVSPKWLWFNAFVGLNILQSAFTNWCPMITISGFMPGTRSTSRPR
jgi:hypothetical protein